jgi:hypothetical protein
MKTNQKKALTKEQAIEKYGKDNVWSHDNGDWGWKDKDGHYHLITSKFTEDGRPRTYIIIEE